MQHDDGSLCCCPAALTNFVHHGMIYVPPGYSYGPQMFGTEVAQVLRALLAKLCCVSAAQLCLLDRPQDLLSEPSIPDVMHQIVPLILVMPACRVARRTGPASSLVVMAAGSRRTTSSATPSIRREQSLLAI